MLFFYLFVVLNISIAQLYGLLSDKLDKETAKNLTSYIEAKVEKEVSDKVSHLASKEDIINLQVEIAHAKVDMLKWTVGLFVTLALMIVGLYFK